MLAEHFLGRRPSHFLKADPIVRAYIISEMFLWSAWNFVLPLFSVFVTQEVRGGSIQLAASGFSIYLISRIIFELSCGIFFSKKSDRKKIIVLIFGIILISASYYGFGIAQNVFQVFMFYIVFGAGMGIAAPVKSALFSVHLDKNKEATEWGIADAASAFAMALSSALAGFVVVVYSFRVLFFLAAIVNLLSIIPYILTIKKR